jgi:hypothetical protein
MTISDSLNATVWQDSEQPPQWCMTDSFRKRTRHTDI